MRIFSVKTSYTLFLPATLISPFEFHYPLISFFNSTAIFHHIYCSLPLRLVILGLNWILIPLPHVQVITSSDKRLSFYCLSVRNKDLFILNWNEPEETKTFYLKYNWLVIIFWKLVAYSLHFFHINDIINIHFCKWYFSAEDN